MFCQARMLFGFIFQCPYCSKLDGSNVSALLETIRWRFGRDATDYRQSETDLAAGWRGVCRHQHISTRTRCDTGKPIQRVIVSIRWWKDESSARVAGQSSNPYATPNKTASSSFASLDLGAGYPGSTPAHVRQGQLRP